MWLVRLLIRPARPWARGRKRFIVGPSSTKAEEMTRLRSSKGSPASSALTRRLAMALLPPSIERIAEAEGWDAVTVRRLATELGVAPGALYYHVRSKQELLSLLATRLLADTTRPEEIPQDLREIAEELTATALSVLAALTEVTDAPATRGDERFLVAVEHISADDLLMRERAVELVEGIEVLMHVLQPQQVLVGIEPTNEEWVAARHAAALVAAQGA